jgi:hypothetical protein
MGSGKDEYDEGTKVIFFEKEKLRKKNEIRN